MSIPAILITTKRLGKVAWAYVAAAAAALGVLAWWWFVWRPKEQNEQASPPVGRAALDQARLQVRDRVSAANAQAAVERAAADTRSDALKEQLAAIKTDKDAARRRRNIIAMAERVARETPPP